MKNKLKVIAFLLAVLFIFPVCLTACGKSNNPGGDSDGSGKATRASLTTLIQNTVDKLDSVKTVFETAKVTGEESGALSSKGTLNTPIYGAKKADLGDYLNVQNMLMSYMYFAYAVSERIGNVEYGKVYSGVSDLIIQGYSGNTDTSAYLTFETLEDGYMVKVDVTGDEEFSGGEIVTYNQTYNIVVKASVEETKTDVYSLSASQLYSMKSSTITQASICEFTIDFTTNKFAAIATIVDEQPNENTIQAYIDKINNGTLTIDDVKYVDPSTSRVYTKGIEMYVGDYNKTANTIDFNGYGCLMWTTAGGYEFFVAEDVLNTMLSGALSKLTGKISVRTQNVDKTNAVFLNNVIGESYLYGYNKTYMYNYNYLFKGLDEEKTIINSVVEKLNEEGVEVDQKYKDMVNAIKIALSEKTDKNFNGMNKFSGKVAGKSFYVETSAFSFDENGKNVLKYEIASSEESTEKLCVEVKIVTNELFKISISDAKTSTQIYPKA